MSTTSGSTIERTNWKPPSEMQKTVDTSTTKRATRVTPDLLKMLDLLAKTRTELYQMSNSSTQWEREMHKLVRWCT
jgi:hypothetical protein